MANLIKICAVLVTIVNLVSSARILGVFHMNSYSHFILGDRILKELAARGHEVTVITPFEGVVPSKNFKPIVLTDYNKQQKDAKKNMFERAEMSTIASCTRLIKFGLIFTETLLSHSSVQELLKSNETFDLVIHEKFLNEAFCGFAHHYNAPSVIIGTFGASRWTSPQMGNPNNPAYVPDIFLGFSSHMNFFERTLNTLVYVMSQLLEHFWLFPKQNELLQKYFPGAPHLFDLHYNTSLILLNSHVSITPPVPLVPNMVEVGGFHLEPSNPLSKDLQDYLDNAQEGVIFFSMGSNLKGADMSEQKRDDFLKVFRGLKQKVLWKWEEDDALPGQPPNVKLGKWLPQQDILAHPNVKLFITHGGLLSLIESVYYGVPVIGIPVFGDQELNMKHVEQDGYGVLVPYLNLNAETLSHAIKKVLSNPKYSKNAKRRSKVMHDQPLKPIDRAIYWIEYVIRHKGAPHLRTAALNLSWYQYLLLDVIAVVLVTLIVVVWMFCKAVKLVCCKKTKVTVNKRKKHN